MFDAAEACAQAFSKLERKLNLESLDVKRHGLDEMLAQLARSMGITKDRVREICLLALKKLRDRLKGRGVGD